jgi:hypothetical protein
METKPPAFTEERQKEFARRAAAVAERKRIDTSGGRHAVGFENKPTPCDCPSGTDTFLREDQSFIVFSTCHTGVPPRVHRAADSGVRVYGGFPSEATALAYARELAESDAECSVQVGRAHDWIVACSELDNITDAEYTATKRNELLGLHHDALERERNRFQQYLDDPDEYRANGLAERDSRECVPSPARDHAADSPENNEGECTSYARRLDRSLELRSQNFAVVSFVNDKPGSRGEFIFCVWSCFDTEVECDAYIRTVAGEHVTDHALHVVSLYDWVRPARMTDDCGVTTHHRCKELDAVTKHARQHGSDLAAFKAFCAEDGEEVPVIDV